MIWLLLATSFAQESEVHWARAEGRIPVRASADAHAEHIGWLLEGGTFAWTEAVEAPGCDQSHWAALVGDGYACLTTTSPAEGPAPVPLVAFDAPRPEEWQAYLDTGTWPRDVDTTEALLPFIYGKRWRRWKAPIYASVEAYTSGEDPVGRLSGGSTKDHFVAVEETAEGAVLVREDGSISPLAETHIYPLDRFEGRDLVLHPPVDGWLAGWVTAYDGAEVVLADGALTTLPYHAAVDVTETEDGWEVDYSGLHGMLVHERDVARWEPTPAPADAEGVWLDLDLNQQVLAIRDGEDTRWATLVSGGKSGPTPRGLYTVSDKSLHDDMASRSDSDDPYLVEEVPWIVHFWPRYAFHAAFWHWGFGHSASHGCVNLSPQDARTVFETVTPTLPEGWHTVLQTEDNPGTLVRIRRGDQPVRDRR